MAPAGACEAGRLLIAAPETIEETAGKVTAAGGTAFAVRVDHTVETEVEALFARVKREQGRLNVLVNSVAGEDPLMSEWASFWNAKLANGETIFRQSLLSHNAAEPQPWPLANAQGTPTVREGYEIFVRGKDFKLL